MRLKIAFILIGLTMFAIMVWASSSGPPNSKTGAPGEGLCTDCHNSFSPNSGDGSLSLQGTPPVYQPGTTYPLTVTLSDPGQTRWGFELAVKDASDQQAGTIVVTDGTNTQTSSSGGITYLKHTSTGTYAGTLNGPVSWNFSWTAPSAGTGTVTFYVAGNAANNNGSTNGDYIYNISKQIPEVEAEAIPNLTLLGLIILVILIVGSGIWYMIKRKQVARV
jgi:hypothetical protein